MFILCACVYVENTAMASWIKNMICSPICACVHVGKVYWINVSIADRSKEDTKSTLLTYVCMHVCIYVWAFCFLKSTRAFFMIFGDNVSRFGSRQKNVAWFFALCPVCDAFCCLSLPLVAECLSKLNSSLFILLG